MKTRIPLRVRIFLILSALMGITVIGALTMFWYTFRIESLITTIIEKDLSAFEAAQALEVALVNQKGYVTYFFQDGDPDWLRQLAEHRRIFEMRLKKAQLKAETPEQLTALGRIESEFTHYADLKDQVIDLYAAGRHAEGIAIHPQARQHFFELLERCEAYRQIFAENIQAARAQSHAEAGRLRYIAVAGLVISLLLAISLAFILIAQILGPVTLLFTATSREGRTEPTMNVVAALSRQVHGLLENVDQTQIALARSRESLLHAEKLAMVGKLAAGMAHSIRNPFTSVKMRLFSLSRSLELDAIQKEDFDVISEEIRHIDAILQNFLEFSRPPKLEMQHISPSGVVDMAMQLLRHRLRSYDVTAAIERSQPLPAVAVDPEQLKEVLVNLMINACEAMPVGGHITIGERVQAEPAGSSVVIEVADNGPGIPSGNLQNLFQPFFTTKKDGTGLGLSIADRIVHEHGGEIKVQSKVGLGTTFTITLPVKTTAAPGRGESEISTNEVSPGSSA
jgi:signal transduction histidine kinase